MANSLREFGRIIETSASTGTGDLVLAGAVAGMRTFGSKFSNGQTAEVVISKDAEWEFARITYSSSGNSIARTQVRASTNGDAAVNWGAGDKTIRVISPGLSDLDDAGRAALLELAMTVSEITVASAATCDILGAASPRVAISGTATVTSLGTGTNKIRFVRATGAFTLTHNATSLILPGGSDIVCTAGDTFIVVSDGSSNARILSYQPANPIDGWAVGFTNVTSGTTTDLGAVASRNVTITGTATITGFGTVKAGVTRKCRVASAGLALTYNATSLILPGGSDIVCTAGDTFTAISLGSGNWIVTDFVPAASHWKRGNFNTLTIASGVLTLSYGGGFWRVANEAAAAADDVDTIDGLKTGEIVVLAPNNGGKVPTFKDGTGNLALAGDCALTSTTSTIMLIANNTGVLFEISRSIN